MRHKANRLYQATVNSFHNWIAFKSLLQMGFYLFSGTKDEKIDALLCLYTKYEVGHQTVSLA